MLRVLDLFSGIGGFSLGLERTGGFRTVAFCEIEPYCRAVLRNHWPAIPCYVDIRQLTGKCLRTDGIAADVICGGFPCQNISIVGDGAGLAGKHSRLWVEFFRLLCELRPQYAIVENVSAVCTRGLGEMVGQLSHVGYGAAWEGIPAAAIGAIHLRARQWILAYPISIGDKLQESTILPRRISVEHSDWWATEPDICRVANGIPNRVDRLRSLGNAVVPQVVEIIGRAILAAESCSNAPGPVR